MDAPSLPISALGDHWPDVAFATLVAVIGFLLRRDISALDKRHERAEKKFDQVDEKIGDHETRISILEHDDERGRES